MLGVRINCPVFPLPSPLSSSGPGRVQRAGRDGSQVWSHAATPDIQFPVSVLVSNWCLPDPQSVRWK